MGKRLKRAKRSNGLLQKGFRFNGKLHIVYGRTEQELSEKERKKREELQKGNDKIYNPTLSQYYEYFTELRRREIKESTLRSQQSQIKAVLECKQENNNLFGDMKIKKIKRRDIERIREELLQQGKTPQNLNIIFAHLNHVFNAATLDETIDKNPCRALKPLKRNKPLVKETKHRALTEKETIAFIEAARECNSYYLNCFLFMLNSGVRVGELTALTRADIDTMQGFIRINKTIQRTETGAYIVGDSTKTKQGTRDIPLTPELQEIVKNQEYLNQMIFGTFSNVVNVADTKKNLLFKSVEGKILREYTLNREIKRICEKQGIKHFTCHAFRNTYATRFIEQRPQDYKILSEILGHKDVSITLNLYTHVMQDKKVEAMNAVKIKVV